MQEEQPGKHLEGFVFSWFVQRCWMCNSQQSRLHYLVWEFKTCSKSHKEASREIGVRALGWKRLKWFCGFGRSRTYFVLIEFASKFFHRWYTSHETHLWSGWFSWEGMKCVLPAVILFSVRACFGSWEELWVMTTEKGHFGAISDNCSLAGMCQIVNYCVGP